MDVDHEHATILIVDDEEVNHVLLRRILNSAGYLNITAFADAREAMTRFDPKQFDLLITDLHIPHMTGLDLIDAWSTHCSRC